MKIRIVKIYEDDEDPSYIYIVADLFKSKHQPNPDERIVNRIKKDHAYKNTPARSIRKEVLIEQSIEIQDIGAFNISFMYFYMLIQNILSKLI
jgi:hypothetical protein